MTGLQPPWNMQSHPWHQLQAVGNGVIERMEWLSHATAISTGRAYAKHPDEGGFWVRWSGQAQQILLSAKKMQEAGWHYLQPCDANAPLVMLHGDEPITDGKTLRRHAIFRGSAAAFANSRCWIEAADTNRLADMLIKTFDDGFAEGKKSAVTDRSEAQKIEDVVIAMRKTSFGLALNDYALNVLAAVAVRAINS